MVNPGISVELLPLAVTVPVTGGYGVLPIAVKTIDRLPSGSTVTWYEPCFDVAGVPERLVIQLLVPGAPVGSGLSVALVDPEMIATTEFGSVCKAAVSFV